MKFVPVVNSDNQPLMPTTPSRARRWISDKKATPFWKKGIFCVRLNVKTEANKQEIALGIDPGSKKEGFTVKSKAHTYLNIQADAVTWVQKVMNTRKMMRRSRRNRNAPCRAPRWNRSRGSLAPSTKARWQWKLRIVSWLEKVFPITRIIVEDVKARTTGKRRWDRSFSPLEVGKRWFYSQINNLVTKQGYETKELRDNLGLKKIGNKLSNSFHAHCVDSWVLANSAVGGDKIDNKEMLLIVPLRFHRRQLHKLQPTQDGIRRREGGTVSLGLKKGSFVKNNNFGLVYVGGNRNGCVSLHSISTGERLTRNARVEDCKFLTYNGGRYLSRR